MPNEFNAHYPSLRSRTCTRTMIAAIISFTTLTSLPSAISAAESPSITVNGTHSSVNGVQRGNVLFVPTSAIFKQIGATVALKPPNTVSATKGGAQLARMTVGSRDAVINGNSQTLATAPFMQAGHVMVPLRLISEAAGASVAYSASPRAVTVNAAHAAAVAAAAPVASANDGAAAGAAAGTVAAAGSTATAAPVADTQTNQGGIPWWVWLLAALVIVGIILALMRRKKEPLIVTTSTPRSTEPVIKTRR